MCESENEAHKVAWIAEACRVQGYRQRSPLHVTLLVKGLRIRRYPGGGRHKRTAVLSRRCGPAEGANKWTGGCLDGRMPLGSSCGCCARASERERTRWTSGLKVRGPTEGGARRKLVWDPQVQATKLPSYLPSGAVVGGGTQGAGWKDKVWGSLFAGRQGQWLGSPFEEAQAGSSETC